eukprot:m51a1_g6740 hypothetical protein (75) ;mRNA; r:226419-226643
MEATEATKETATITTEKNEEIARIRRETARTIKKDDEIKKNDRIEQLIEQRDAAIDKGMDSGAAAAADQKGDQV